MNKARILVVDDDVDIGNMEKTVLEKAGYDVVRAFSGTDALLKLNDYNVDLVILDLMLPGLSGESILPKISERTKGIPVIIVSAKIDADSRVNMLMEGACDYVTKPFDTRELVARIALRLKEKSSPSVLSYDDILLDDAAHSVTCCGKAVQLTPTEYKILKMLLEKPSEVVTKSSLIDKVSSENEDCTESSLKTHISHLRGKLKNISGKDYIESVWGIGFKMK